MYIVKSGQYSNCIQILCPSLLPASLKTDEIKKKHAIFQTTVNLYDQWKLLVVMATAVVSYAMCLSFLRWIPNYIIKHTIVAIGVALITHNTYVPNMLIIKWH